jgi:hypothetical protein
VAVPLRRILTRVPASKSRPSTRRNGLFHGPNARASQAPARAHAREAARSAEERCERFFQVVWGRDRHLGVPARRQFCSERDTDAVLVGVGEGGFVSAAVGKEIEEGGARRVLDGAFTALDLDQQPLLISPCWAMQHQVWS